MGITNTFKVWDEFIIKWDYNSKYLWKRAIVTLVGDMLCKISIEWEPQEIAISKSELTNIGTSTQIDPCEEVYDIRAKRNSLLS